MNLLTSILLLCGAGNMECIEKIQSCIETKRAGAEKLPPESETYKLFQDNDFMIQICTLKKEKQ